MPNIIICGGSLAGMACAIRLKQLGYDPVIFDKSRFPRKKLCGEFLGPDAFPLLQILGVFEAVKTHAYGPVEKTLFYNQKGQALTIHHRWIHRQWPYALAIPRETLDNLLIRHAQDLGLQCHEQCRITAAIRLRNAKFVVEVLRKEADLTRPKEQAEAEILVDATGRNGNLFLQVHPPPKAQGNHRVAIQCHVRFNEKLPQKDLAMFLFPGGYGGIQPISSQTANLCMMLDASLAKSMHDPFQDFITTTIGQNPAASHYLTHTSRDGDFSTTANINLPLANQLQKRKHPDDAYLIRVGDALVTVDPFTGSGMAHALETGMLAAEIIHTGLQNKQDYRIIQAQYQQAYRRRFQARLLFMNRFRPLLESTQLQNLAWPLLPPLMPLLAHVLR